MKTVIMTIEVPENLAHVIGKISCLRGITPEELAINYMGMSATGELERPISDVIDWGLPVDEGFEYPWDEGEEEEETGSADQ